MPIVIPRDLPAFDSLLHEKIFVMDGSNGARSFKTVFGRT